MWQNRGMDFVHIHCHLQKNGRMQENTEKAKNYEHISFILKVVKLRHISLVCTNKPEAPRSLICIKMTNN